MHRADAVRVPDVLILPGRASANLLNRELRAGILGNENSADVLSNRADTDQLDAAYEQHGDDDRRPSLRPLCPINVWRTKYVASAKANSDIIPPRSVAIRKGTTENAVASLSQTATDFRKL